MSERLRGFIAAVLAFIIWGLLPFYWKRLSNIPALEIIAYRVFMTFWVLSLYFVFRFKDSKKVLNTKIILLSCVSAIFLALNWLIYVWGVNNDRIIECSLGYYITPLVSVLFGRIFFKERFSVMQIVSIALATISVLLLTMRYGKVPFVALGLALSFSLYSVFRKKSPIESIYGLFLEMSLLSPIVLLYLIFYGHNILNLEIAESVLLLLSGIVTATPLLFYVYSIRILRLSTVGMLQYIGPTMMLIIGLFVYKEMFSITYFVSFVLIWIGVGIFIKEIKRNSQ